MRRMIVGSIVVALLVVLPAVHAATDTQPPTTRFAFQGPTASVNGTRWMGALTQIVLDASDDSSGVASTSYAIDGGPTVSYAGPFHLDAQSGVHTVTFGSVDNAGNVESPRSQTVHLDATAPSLRLVSPEPRTTYVGPETIIARDGSTTLSPGVTVPLTAPFYARQETPVVYGSEVIVRVSAADNDTGIHSWSVIVDGTPWATATSTNEVMSVPITGGPGVHALRIVAVDLVGNAVSVDQLVETRSQTGLA